ncbi:Mitochondrial acidic protein mam33 [Nowakowskiella sp. JEL0407]|nr:Mitochondrial acidic protein mam33 [Nowakowskiella sp. JEL0407]
MFARSVLRSIAPATKSICFTSNLLQRNTLSILSRSALVSSRSFSVSAFARSQGLVDKDLVQKLKEEHAYELENGESETPEFLKSFQNLGIWKIEDKTGEKEVTLSRTFGSEKISVIFSTDALNTAEEDMGEGDEESEPESPYAVNLTIIMEKKSAGHDHGAIEVVATLQDSQIYIDNVSFNSSSSLAVDTTAEADWQRRGKYGGPIFQDLDEDLQDLFQKYIEERGIDENFSNFIPSYLEYKEQKEYVSWLKNVEKFVKA